MKKIIIISLFLGLFFTSSHHLIIAETPTPETTTTEEESNSWNIWEAIGSFLSNILNGISGIFVSQNTIIPCQEESKFTDYNNDTINTNYRMQSASSQKYRKGSYLKAIINGDYEDKTISYLCDNVCSNSKINDSSCIEIKYSTLVYYFYKKGEKILYDKDNPKTPTDYDSAKMETYNYNIPANSDAYFKNIYNKISQIPQGAYKGEEDGATTSSNELNGSTRYIQPASSQTDKPSSDISIEENAENMVKDNDINQQKFYSAIIPAKNQKILGTSTDSNNQVLGISTDINALKTKFANNLHPASWQDVGDSLVEREDYNSNWSGNGSCSSGGSCNAEKSHCRGMSQYGALGLSQSGKNYEEILKFYYGDIQIKKLDTSNTDIKVNVTDADRCPDGSSLNVEDYLRGLGEMPDYWGKDSKGGFQAMKAQVVAARTYAYMRTQGFTKAICNSSKCQVFRCSAIGRKPFLDKAVKETTGEILVDLTTGTPFSTEYARSFCGPSKTVTCSNHTIPSVNSEENKNYEGIGLASTNRKSNAYCK